MSWRFLKIDLKDVDKGVKLSSLHQLKRLSIFDGAIFVLDDAFISSFMLLNVLKVRGVGAGGIVSTAYCILYKLYTLRLTRKQVMGLINHGDSPYIRGLGFMYIR